MSGNDEIDHSVNKTTEKYDSVNVNVNNKLSATTGNNDNDNNEKLSSSSSSSSSLNENSKKQPQITAQNNNNNNNNNNGDNKISTPPTSITMTATNNNTTITPPKPTKRSSKKTEWVQFDDEDKMTIVEMPSQQQNNKSHTSDDDVAPAVLTTESVHINIAANNSKKQNILKQIHSAPAVIDIPITTMTSSSVQIPSSISSLTTLAATQTSTATASAAQVSGLRTIELSTGRVREGFANGDIIVTLLPINTKWPWITPAIFRPELVPEELMAQGLTLTVEEYVHAMETLVNDVRFTFYNVCYKRVLVCWILFAFGVLLGLLFSGLNGITLFSLGVAWLFLNAAAIFFCMWIKLRLSRGLERCLASVNKQLLRHKIILALDDRGKISCHKVNLCFMYYDPAQCVGFLNEFIERNEQNGTSIETGWETRLDVNVNDIVIQGSSTTRVSRKQERGILLLLRYASRWGNEVIRGLAAVSITEPARHCAPFICPCQYIERHLSCKPRGKFKIFNIGYWVTASERYE